MALLINNGGYAFLIGLDLMTLWEELQSLQILNDLSTKHLMKLILYENDVNLYKIQEKSRIGSFAICLKCEILIIDTWNEFIKEGNGMVNLFFDSKFNILCYVRCLLSKKNLKI